MLDLNKLETKLNEALEKETVESLKLWVNMNRIIKTVCSHFYMTEGKLKRKTRKREVVLPRQIAMYLAVKHTELSTDEIGGSLGKSRMTALYSFYKIRDLMKIDKQLEEQVKQIEEELYGR
ncbi:Chromosomal replication initiator protein DnaA [Bacteroides pyogenes]|nr:Chromosomal replication initiator protein DnaA [Bacteroides pyogenes]MBR8755839.1 Chromosomal replication initiator protein DnaA [Bacteroides pyogenes]MBR8810761.1 Chromosomal replication initiator protein DnaA [Bacteroides pyogenes]